ncbi:homoserine dehydrogenase, partial [Oceanobacillus caeni]
EDVKVKGISNISLDDLKYANKLGYTMKLIGNADFKDDKIEVDVQPTMLAKNHPLASVNDEFNAVYVYGDAVGETMFYGPGAGSLPTATAITSDVVSVIKNMLLGVTGSQHLDPHFDKQLKTADKRFGQYYVRLHVKDEVGVFSRISALFNDLNISFKRILQNPIIKDENAEIIVV